MSGARSATGLICSAGSGLDFRIPRAKLPSRALPDDVRRKLKLPPRKGQGKTKVRRDATPAVESDVYSAGSGVLKPRESSNGEYAAGCQKNFLRRGTGRLSLYKLNKKGRITSSAPTQPAVNVVQSGGSSEGSSKSKSRGNRESRRTEQRRVEVQNMKRMIAMRRKQLNKE
jgi:hypothetical protein